MNTVVILKQLIKTKIIILLLYNSGSYHLTILYCSDELKTLLLQMSLIIWFQPNYIWMKYFSHCLT